MVKMVPPSQGGNTNYGERALFEKLLDDQSHPNWIAIHNLKQSLTSKQFEAEGDFIVLVPGKGLVVIEVKGATGATLEGETWTFEGVAEKAVHKSPLEQINVTRNNIKRRFRDNDLDDMSIPMARLVWLPKLEPFKFAHIGDKGFLLGHWEIAFAPDLESAAATIERCLDEYIKSVADNPDINFAPETFTEEYAAKVQSILLVEASSGATLERLTKIQQAEIAKATENQLEMLDSFIENKDIYLEGAAGTGKSRMLGLAAVKMANEGRKVLLTCYNLMMADFFAQEYGRHPNIDVISIHDLFFQTIPQKQGKTTQDWYNVELPHLAYAAIEMGSPFAKYDSICIDEFQDVATKEEVLKAIFYYFSPDSPLDPRVVLAADDAQNIYGEHEDKSSFAIAKGIFPEMVKIKANKNCRQAPDLSEAIQNFLNFRIDGLKHAVPRDVESSFEVIRPMAGKETEALADVLSGLLAKYSPDQIRVLSPYGNKSLIGTLFTREATTKDERWLKTQLRHLSTKGQVRWRGIGKFKGLESDVVVITDINETSKEWAASIGLYLEELLYVGMTRAKFHLVVLVGDDLFKQF